MRNAVVYDPDDKITAVDVWAYADEGVITEEQATLICGQRPSV